jgi:molecular chaperone GrpE
MGEPREPMNGPDRPEEGTPNASSAEAAASAAEDTASPLELRRRIVELDDLWLRAVADLDNQRKRFARELEREREHERERVSAEWLPVLDNLERALEHAEAEPQALLHGIAAVRDQAVDVLARQGFPRRDAVGEMFDPVRHAAAATTTDTDAPPGTVVEVLQPGYGEGEHQLRPALVVVAQKAD